jgi:hypothetical protein
MSYYNAHKRTFEKTKRKTKKYHTLIMDKNELASAMVVGIDCLE